MSPGIEALAAVLGCEIAAAGLAAVLAATDKLRVTVSVGPRRRPKPPSAGSQM